MALGFMRRHRRWLYVFLWLVILTFVIFFGIPMDEIAGTEGVGATVAEVGDRRITAADYTRAYNDQRRFYQRNFQGRLDDETLKRMGLEEQALQGLIDQHVLVQEAERLGLTVDDESLKAYIRDHPNFQANGRFIGGPELRRIMERQGLTVEQFEKEMRQTLLREMLESLVTDGVSVTDADVEAEYRRRNEKVKVEYVLAAADPATVAVTEDEVKAHFEKEKESYRLPERRVLSFILLDPPLVQSRVTITERDKRAYYDAHKDEYRREEEICAAHVLVKVKSEEQPEGHAEAEARALAQKALEELKGGKDIAEVARRVSEDQASAPRGGDLGCFGRGRMVGLGPEFDDVAFQLRPGEVSDLVRTPEGFHVIRVSARRDEAVEDFDTVKPGIEQALLATRGREVAGEMAGAIGAALAGGRSLEDAARDQGVAVQKSPPLARGEARPPLASPAVLARAFELTRGQTAPEPLPVGGGAAFVRVDEVQPPRMPDFAEVKDAVQAALKRERAFERARGLAAEVKGRAADGGLEKAAVAYGLVRKQTDAPVSRGQAMGDLGTGAALEEAAFTLPPQALSEPVRTARGYAILRVLEKQAADPAALATERAAIRAALQEQKRGQLFRAYLQEARKRFKVERHDDVLRKLVG